MKLPKGWELKCLEDVVSSEKYAMVDGPFGSNLKSEHYRSEGIPVLQSGFVTSGKFYANSYVYVDKQLFIEQKRSAAKGGDILMAKIGAQAGRCAIIPDNHPQSIIAGNCLKLSFDKNSTEFFNFILSFNYEKNGLAEIKTETAQPAISLKSLKAYRVPVPPLIEQNKIAKILSTWDRAISTTELLLANSQQQKKALMQQLLTGKKRLLDNNGVRFSGDWKVEPIAHICTINPKRSPEPSNGVVSFVAMDSVSEDARLLNSVERQYSDVSTGFTSFADDDVLVAKITPCFENGKGAYVQGMVNGIGFGSTEFHVLRAKPKVSSKFVYYLTNTSEFRIRGEANMQGSAGQKRVTTDYLKSLIVRLPSSIEEQQKIAAVLSTADQEISALQQKLAALKQEKKALMQQLLTGKRRVRVEEAA